MSRRVSCLFSRIAFLVVVPCALGQGLTFSSTTIQTEPTGATAAVGTADVNNDGNPDIIAFANSGFAVLLGNGNGSFGAPIPNSSVTAHPPFAIADVNRDGKLDLVSIAGVQLGNGDGTFGSPIAFVSPYSAIADLALGDFNNDGKLDVAVTENLQGVSAVIYLGNGDGTFQQGSRVSNSAGVLTSQVKAVDVNNDGKLDLVVTLTSGTQFAVQLGNGDGTFQGMVFYQNDYAGEVLPTLAVGDLNGDGLPDVVIAGGGSVGVSLGQTGGGFQNAAIYSLTNAYAYDVKIADMNGDGKLDVVVVVNRGIPSLASANILLGIGNGTFGAPVSSPADELVQSVAIADFNRDGRLDMVTSAPSASGITVMLNVGSPTCSYMVTLPFSLTNVPDQGSGTGMVSVSTGYNCSWSYSVSDFTWIDLNDAYSTETVTGPAQLSLTIDESYLPPRTGTITIAGQTFTVTQQSGACAIQVSGSGFLSPGSSVTIPAAGGPFAVNVTANQTFCQWSAYSPDSFITVTPYQGEGSASLTIKFAPNFTSNELQGTVWIYGQEFTVVQMASGQAYADVAPTDYYYSAVNLLQARGITSGCGGSPPLYCPLDPVTRADMAIFIVRSIEGEDNFTYNPIPYFSDVPIGAFGFQWIQKLYELGITAGCGYGNYCPNDTVDRDQMAIMIIRARYGAATPFTWNPAQIFQDVPPGYYAFDWIQRLYSDAITAGCGTNPLVYCPGGPVTRGDMAIFLMRGAFNQLFPPTEPIISYISPSSLSAGASGTFTVTGTNTNFQQGVTQLVFPVLAGVTVSSINVTSPTTMQVNLSASSSATGPLSIYEETGAEEAVLPNGLWID